MNALRNMSGQSFLIHKTGGALVHLFPGRAVALADEELKSAQIQSLIAAGLARIQSLVPPRAAKAAKAGSTQHEPHKHEAPERKHEKKKDES